MRVWSEINWGVMDRRAREIEAAFWQGSPAPDDLKEKDVVADVTQANRVDAQALMVWCDDGGSPDHIEPAT